MKKYFQLPWSDQILLMRIFIMLGFVRLMVLIIPFRYVATYLGKHMQESPVIEKRENELVQRIRWAIKLMSGYTPWDSKCLVQAIAGKIFLRQKRLQNTLYLGVAKNQENNLIAHAWLCCGKAVVTGGGLGDKFTIVGKFVDIIEVSTGGESVGKCGRKFVWRSFTRT